MANNPQDAIAAFQARIRDMVRSQLNPEEIGRAVQGLVQSCLEYGLESYDAGPSGRQTRSERGSRRRGNEDR